MADVATTSKKTVVYCGVCHMPPEYCEFGASLPRCRQWLENHQADLYARLYTDTDLAEKLEKVAVVKDDKDAAEDLDADTKKLAKAIGKEEAKLKREEVKRQTTKVLIKRIERTKRKRVTTIQNLEIFDIDLKKAAKAFASRFACGSSVSKNNQNQDEIVIQGDVSEEVKAYILNKWKSIPEKNIQLSEEKKKPTQ